MSTISRVVHPARVCFLVAWMLVGAAPAGAQQFVVSHLAGPRVGGPGSADGTGSMAQFAWPYQIAADSAGNIYVADAANKTIRRMTPTGVVSTVAGQVGVGGEQDGPASTALFGHPTGIAVDSAGNVFVSAYNGHTIRKITPGGTVSTVAGQAYSSGTADGTGSAARFYNPYCLAIDGSDNLYVADSGNNKIRKITPAGEVTTLAGSPTGAAGSADGVGTDARFNHPYGILSDFSGNVYVSDSNNHTIRKISTPGAVVTTIAGLAGQAGSADGVGSAARFNGPEGLALDGDGNLYVADWYSHTIRRIATDATVTTVAGLGGTSGWADGAGSTARFSYPTGIVVTSPGTIYVSDNGNSTIRAMTAAGDVTTVAGRAAEYGGTDGPADLARFTIPTGLAVDSSGNTFVVDRDNCVIRKITAAGFVSTFVGSQGVCGSADGTGSAAQFSTAAMGLAIDGSDNLYVADYNNNTIRKVTPAGVVTTFAGAAGQAGSVDGAASVARFTGPRSIAATPAGVLYVTDTGTHTIRAIALDGTVTTIAGLAGQTGSADGTGTAARFNTPRGIALSPLGWLYVADTLNHTIRLVTPGGFVATLAGQVGVAGSGDGVGTQATFNNPYAITIDPAGVAYIADYSNNMIRRFSPDGMVRKIAGPPGPIIFGHTDGAAPQARFAQPYFIAYNRVRNGLVVSEAANHAIRYLQHVQTLDGDEDGKPDPTVFRPSTGMWYVRFSTTNYTTMESLPWGLAGDVPAGGDFNGDGIGEPAVFRPSTGTWFVMDPEHGFWSWFGWGVGTDTPVPGDYDGDGAADGAVYRASTGTWYVRPSYGGAAWSMVFGQPGDIPVPADYDADGRTDVAVYRPASGTWFILKSSTNNTQWYYRGWGVDAQGDVPAPGDYDGDGKADICVFRPANGTWFILKSSAGDADWLWFGWGAVGDKLVPADYDGDGITDAAVFRPSNGTWYVRPSNGAAQFSFVLGEAGDIPAWWRSR